MRAETKERTKLAFASEAQAGEFIDFWAEIGAYRLVHAASKEKSISKQLRDHAKGLVEASAAHFVKKARSNGAEKEMCAQLGKIAGDKILGLDTRLPAKKRLDSELKEMKAKHDEFSGNLGRTREKPQKMKRIA